MNITPQITIAEIIDVFFSSNTSINVKDFNKNTKNYIFFIFDINHISRSFVKWEEKFENYKKSLHKGYCFIDLLLAGFFTGNAFDTTNKNRFSGLINNTDNHLNCHKKRFLSQIENKKMHTTSDNQNICEGALIIRIIYEAQSIAINQIYSEADTTLFCSNMNKLLISHGYEKFFDYDDISNQWKKSDDFLDANDEQDCAKILLYAILLALGAKEEFANYLLYKKSSYDHMCFNPDINIFQNFETPNQYMELLAQTGIINTAGSLELLKKGADFCKNPETTTTTIDGYTLLTLADTYFYQSINTSLEDSLINAYICSCVAQKRGFISASYNIAYYHYILASDIGLERNSRFKKLKDYMENPKIPTTNKDLAWGKLFENECNKSTNLSHPQNTYAHHLSVAIEYLCQIGRNGNHTAAFTSLGNISIKEYKENSKGKTLLSPNDSKRIKECHKKIYKELYGKAKNGRTSDIKEYSFNDIAFDFYKYGANQKNLESTYNYVRMIEKRLINPQLKLEQRKELEDNLYTCLFSLKENRHPKGVNVYLQYVLYYMQHKGVITLDENFYRNNDDLKPIIYKEQYIEPINFEDTEIKTLDDIISCYEYVSNYTLKQLKFFWVIYHYCLLKFMRITSSKELKKLRILLTEALSNDIIKKEPEYQSDSLKGYLLLLKIANFENTDNNIENTELEKEIISGWIKEQTVLKETLSSQSTEPQTMTEQSIRTEYAKLQKSLSKSRGESLVEDSAKQIAKEMTSVLIEYIKDSNNSIENKLSFIDKKIDEIYFSLH